MSRPAERLSIASYLEWENQQVERHEFYRGEIFAMVGARRAHGCVVVNLSAALRSHLRGSPCRAFTEGMKLQVADDAIFYPDLLVTCDQADLATEMIFRAPTLIIEVLSPATASYDRGLKFATYRRIPSLREVIFVDPDSKRIDGFRRNERDEWVLHDMSDGPALEAASVGCSVPLAEVFDGVDPPA